MNMSKFYAYLRLPASEAFGRGLSQSEVDGIEAILNECASNGATLRQAAYILATAYGETGGRMQPVRENMNYKAARILEVWPTRFTAQTALNYQYKPMALANYVYNGRLGNRPGTNDGWDFRGALIGQFTGRDHFLNIGMRLGIDLVENPELLEDLGIAAKSLVRGMLEGWATAYKLSDFVGAGIPNYVGARAVWNGSFEAAKYAKLATSFENALISADWVPGEVVNTSSASSTSALVKFDINALFASLIKFLMGGK